MSLTEAVMPKPSVLVACLLLCNAASAAAPLNLLQNEYVFARDVAARGVRDGFLLHLDKSAITFAPQPVNAYDFYSRRKPGTTKLSWYPVLALVSAAGDFGVDTGPWRADYTEDGKDESSNGEWLTVWIRDKSGAWRALFDGGVGHAPPERPAPALPEDGAVTQMPALTGPAPAIDAVQAELERQEALFSDTAVRQLKAAYASVAADDIHLLLEDSQPLVGRERVLKLTPATSSGLEWVPIGGSVADSGDLGYVYGMTYKPEDRKRKTPQGVYVHVWRRDPGGWKLALAEESPLPKPSKKK